MRGLIIFLSTGAFLGYFPIIPGTVGTLGGIFIYLTLAGFPFFIKLLTNITLVILSFWLAEEAERLFKEQDSPKIVVDEMVGYQMTMFLIPNSWVPIFEGFIIFRILDILKPFPSNKVNRWKGGLGVVLDDLISGLYSNILLQILTGCELRVSGFG